MQDSEYWYNCIKAKMYYDTFIDSVLDVILTSDDLDNEELLWRAFTQGQIKWRFVYQPLAFLDPENPPCREPEPWHPPYWLASCDDKS